MKITGKKEGNTAIWVAPAERKFSCAARGRWSALLPPIDDAHRARLSMITLVCSSRFVASCGNEVVNKFHEPQRERTRLK